MRASEIEAQCKKLVSEKQYVRVMQLWKEHIFPENMTAAQVRSEWYKALFEEDCLRIMKLLKIDPNLVEVGWGSEDRIVEGSPHSHLYPTGKYRWQGRTALHVCARRGCIELVKQVLELYGLNVRAPSNPSESEKADRQVNKVASRSSRSDRKDKNDVSSSDHTGHRNSESAGFSSHNTDSEGQSACISLDDGATSDTRSSEDSDGRESERHDQKIAGESTQGAQKNGDRDTGGIGIMFNSQKDLLDLLVSKDGRKDKIDVSSSDHTGHRNSENAGFSSHNTDSKGQSACISLDDGATSDTRSSEDSDGRESERHDQEIAGESTQGAQKNDDRDTGGIGIMFNSQKDLLDLLVSKDGIYNIDVLAIAIMHFKSDLFNLLVYAIGECGTNPYGIEKITVSESGVGCDHLSQARSQASESGSKCDHLSQASNRQHLLALRQATKESLLELSDIPGPTRLDIELFLKEYSVRHRDFNFYAADVLEYAFHFSFAESYAYEDPPKAYSHFAVMDSASWVISENVTYMEDFRLAFWKMIFGKHFWAKVRKSRDNSTPLWRSVLEFQDGQGRTPSHVAADERFSPSEYSAIFTDGGPDVEDVRTCLLTATDGAGRPLPRRVAVTHGGFTSYFKNYISNEWDHSVLNTMALSTVTWAETINKVLEVNGFPRIPLILYNSSKIKSGAVSSLLRAAIIRKQVPTTELVQSDFHDLPNDIRTDYDLTTERPDDQFLRRFDHVKLGALELACLVEDYSEKQLLKLLDQVGDLVTSFQEGRDYNVAWAKNPFQALHIVAAHGNYKLLKMFLDHRHCDPFIKDYLGNSALHYAMQEPFDCIEPSLLEYVSCQDLLENRPSQTMQKKIMQKKILHENAITERQGCVFLLLQAGCEIFERNAKGEVPYPQGRLANSPKFVSWWHERQEKEFAATTSSFNNATNAISVTAKLVATASYVGPLQPPLSYAANPTNNVNQIQYENVWVATFLFCDTLSFYLAIIAIILSLIPSLPVPQQAMVLELRRTKAMMIMAVSVLIPSIICVLIAFAASSIAVVSAGNITSQIGGKLTIATLSISGPFFLAAILLFSIRLLIILFPRTSFIRHFYECTSFEEVVKKLQKVQKVEIVRKLIRLVKKLPQIVTELVRKAKTLPHRVKKLREVENEEIVRKLVRTVKKLVRIVKKLPTVKELVRKVKTLPHIVKKLVRKVKKLSQKVKKLVRKVIFKKVNKLSLIVKELVRKVKILPQIVKELVLKVKTLAETVSAIWEEDLEAEEDLEEED